MPRTTHHQRIARGLAKATHLTYQQALEKVTAAAAGGRLPSPLDKAGVARAVELLAARTVDPYVSAPCSVPGDAALNRIFDQPHGIVLVTGLIGTGKTTLMYETALRLAAQGCQVVTFEDPIEQSLTSASILGSIRQIEGQPSAGWIGDPDVVIVSELRRRDDIEAAVHLAYTGHLVIAGLYSHSAEEALHRVVDAYPLPEQPDARHGLADTLIAVVEMSRENGQHEARTLVIDETMRTGIRTGPAPVDPEAEARSANIRAGHPPLGHEFWGVAGHPDDDECTHREDGTDATYCGLTADEHGYLDDEWDLLTEVLEANRGPQYDISDLDGTYPPLTREEFEPGATVINGIAFHDTEDATIFSWGHVDKQAYADVVTAYSDSTRLADRPDDETPAGDLVSIRHVWAVNTRSVDSVAGWWLRWDDGVTEDTPGAFAVTLAEY